MSIKLFANNPIKKFFSKNKPAQNAVSSPIEGFKPNGEGIKPLERDTIQISSKKEEAIALPEAFLEPAPVYFEDSEKDAEFKGLIHKKAEEYGINDVKGIRNIEKNLSGIFVEDEEKFNYVLNSEFLFGYAQGDFGGDLFKEFSLQRLKIIESQSLIQSKEDDETVRDYVRSSDYFNLKPGNTEKLTAILSRFKTDEDVVVYRGDKGTGIFDTVELKKEGLEAKIRKANKENKAAAEKVPFAGFSKLYGDFDYPEDFGMTLYEYINTAERITLADAMVMMPYLDEETRGEVLDELKGVRTVDNRFKSTTLNEHFAKSWILKRKEISSIYNTITLKKGMEGIFPRNSLQSEFILNAKPKVMTVKDAKYDASHNRFEIESEIEMGE